MAIYEIDTLKSSLKKYTVVLAAGVGIGLYLSNCAFKPNKTYSESRQTHIESVQQPRYQTRELTREEQRLQIFESYVRK